MNEPSGGPAGAPVRAGLSLRAQLMVAAVLMVLVPGGIYGAIALRSSRAALAEAGGRLLMQEARGAADRLSAALLAEQARVGGLATQDVMREIRIGDLDKRISVLLASARRNCPACVDLLARDARGRVVASSNPGLIGQTSTMARFEIPAIRGPAAVPGRSPVLQVGLAIPDPDVADLTLGDLVALLDLERVIELSRRVRENLRAAGLDTSVLVVDSGGALIGGALDPADPWRVGQSLPPVPAGDPAIGFIDEASGHLVGYAALADRLPEWSVRVTEPLDQAYAPARRTAQRLALALLAVLGVALLLAVLAAGRLSRPLAQLARAAAAVGRGERPIPALPIESNDEVGTLTAAFNRMAADLARVEHDLVEAAKFSFVGELAAGVAHEVRTPLGVMRSSAQMLARSPEITGGETLELLALLQSEVDRVDRVVSALLDLGRPRHLQAGATPLAPLLQRAARFVEAQARQKRIELDSGAFDRDPPVWADPELLYQVMLNLLVNAVQVLPEGGRIDVGLLAPRAGFAGFQVRDNGPGMSPEVRERLFQPFFTRREGGTGLGLTFVQRVVHEHRGRIEVDSAPGRGTAFRVWIPVGAGKEDAP